MTEQIWKTHTPQYDGHAPDDYSEAFEVEIKMSGWWGKCVSPSWVKHGVYRYRAKQPDLLAQCLALPQADRDALIAELQKPVRDWADDVWAAAFDAWACAKHPDYRQEGTAVIRSMCLSKEDPLLTEIFNFLGGVDGAAELRGRLLNAMGTQS